MKKIALVLIVFVVASAFMLHSKVITGVHGTIDPRDAAERVWAISGKDSTSIEPIMGSFSMELMPGNWTIVVVAKAPFKNAVIENVSVKQEQSTDMGLIKLTTE